MYIISKQKDYYDGVAGTMGVDKMIVYNRQLIDVEECDIPKEFKRMQNSQTWRLENPFLLHYNTKKESKYDHVYPFVIGFCGKLYVGWRFNYKVKNPNSFYEETKTDIVYDHKIAEELIHPYFREKTIMNRVSYIENFDAMNVFSQFNTPVFVLDEHYGFGTYYKSESYFVVNPILDVYQFYKKFNSFDAFQEVSMFIGGVLGSNENKTVEIEDKYKISQYGYDKWSFRKEPSKKK